MKLAGLFVLAICCIGSLCAAEVKISGPQSAGDLSYGYFSTLLQKALASGRGSSQHYILVNQPVLEQSKTITALLNGSRDVLWVGTDKYREQVLRPIKIPLVRGLLGFRRPIVHKGMLAAFNQVSSIVGLSEMVGCQGTNWPDSRILLNAGMTVLLSLDYAQMFALTDKGRCDYFPRAFFEAPVEINRWKETYPNLVLYPDLVLRYPFAIYFFTRKQDEALARVIERGLERMIERGQLLAHMQSHPFTAHMFPLNKNGVRRVFELTNPDMNESGMIYKDKRYWVTLEEVVDGE